MRFPTPAVLFPLLSLATVALAPRIARAAPPSPDLMARLAARAVAMEELRTRATFAMEGHVETLDGDGKVVKVKTSSARVVKEEGDKRPHTVVLKATEDGKDSTEDERKEVRERESKSEEDRTKEHLDIPFMAEAQPKYVFDQVETDPSDPSRVRIAFKPKQADSHSIEGSAWVNATDAQFLSAGFKVCKPGALVEFVHVTIELGAKTELGPAVSKVSFEGKGGFLFIRKHFRGTEILSDYRLAPK
jgi:hypothetical protein